MDPFSYLDMNDCQIMYSYHSPENISLPSHISYLILMYKILCHCYLELMLMICDFMWHMMMMMHMWDKEKIAALKSWVADVEKPQYRRYPKGQGLLRKEGPPKYAILSQNLVLSRFTLFMNGHHRAFVEPTFVELSESFRRAFGEPTFGELSYNQYITKVQI